MKKNKDPKLKKLLAYLHTIDAKEVLDDLQIGYTTTGKNVSEGWIGVSCPFCNDTSNHLGIHLSSKAISCFSCGTSGTIIRLVNNVLGYSKGVDYLSKLIPRELVKFDIDAGQKKTLDFSKIVDIPEIMYSKKKAHWNYIKKIRKFDPKELFRKYQLQCISHTNSMYGNRIFVPIFRHNKIVTFTTIDINEYSRMRYKHCPDSEAIIPIKDLLYGVEYTDGHECIVVEGLFDAWRIGDGAVTPFGTKMTDLQIKELKKFQRVKLCYDGDAPGRAASKYVASQLAVFTEVIELFIPFGDDPDKLSKKDIEYIKNY